jgi:hypothetical protein
MIADLSPQLLEECLGLPQCLRKIAEDLAEHLAEEPVQQFAEIVMLPAVHDHVLAQRLASQSYQIVHCYMSFPIWTINHLSKQEKALFE